MTQCTRSTIVDHRAGTLEPQFDDWLREHDWEMELNLPLRVGDRSVEALTLNRSAERPYSPPEVALAEALVKQFTLAVEATRLAEEASSRAVEVALYQKRLVERAEATAKA